MCCLSFSLVGPAIDPNESMIIILHEEFGDIVKGNAQRVSMKNDHNHANVIAVYKSFPVGKGKDEFIKKELRLGPGMDGPLLHWEDDRYKDDEDGNFWTCGYIETQTNITSEAHVKKLMLDILSSFRKFMEKFTQGDLGPDDGKIAIPERQYLLLPERIAKGKNRWTQTSLLLVPGGNRLVHPDFSNTFHRVGERVRVYIVEDRGSFVVKQSGEIWNHPAKRALLFGEKGKERTLYFIAFVASS